MLRTYPPRFWISCLAQVCRITTVSVRSEDLVLEPVRQLVNTRARRSGNNQQNPLRLHLQRPRKEDGKLLRIEIRRRSGTQGVRLGVG